MDRAEIKPTENYIMDIDKAVEMARDADVEKFHGGEGEPEIDVITLEHFLDSPVDFMFGDEELEKKLFKAMKDAFKTRESYEMIMSASNGSFMLSNTRVLAYDLMAIGSLIVELVDSNNIKIKNGDFFKNE